MEKTTSEKRQSWEIGDISMASSLCASPQVLCQNLLMGMILLAASAPLDHPCLILHCYEWDKNPTNMAAPCSGTASHHPCWNTYHTRWAKTCINTEQIAFWAGFALRTWFPSSLGFHFAYCRFAFQLWICTCLTALARDLCRRFSTADSPTK